MSHGPHESPGSFSLTRGGPFFGLAQRFGLDREGVGGLVLRSAIAIAVLYLPLVVLAALQDVLLGARVQLPLLHDLTVYARFLIAVPMLVHAEGPIDRRLSIAIEHFRKCDLVEDHAKPAFEEAVRKMERARDSVLVEIVLLVLVFTLAWINHHSTGNLPVSSWRSITPAGAHDTTWAGTWADLVSFPIFSFLVLRWLWRMFLWSRFLARVSRIDLKLVPTHPDGSAGLAFLGIIQTSFSLILIPIAATVSARGVEWVRIGGWSTDVLRNALIVFAVIALAIVIGPLQAFVPKLVRTKRRGLLEYAGLATQYTRAFDRKWLRSPAEEPLLGSADIQSLADLGNSYGIIRGMRVVPLSREDAITLVLATALPMLPFLWVILPLEEMLVHAAQLIMR